MGGRPEAKRGSIASFWRVAPYSRAELLRSAAWGAGPDEWGNRTRNTPSEGSGVLAPVRPTVASIGAHGGEADEVSRWGGIRVPHRSSSPGPEDRTSLSLSAAETKTPLPSYGGLSLLFDRMTTLAR